MKDAQTPQPPVSTKPPVERDTITANLMRFYRSPPSADSDPNAEWLTTAHMVCADVGIAPGHISTRLESLRGQRESLRGQRMVLDAYLIANYPDAKGDTVTDRAINALERMDTGLGMREVKT